MIALIRLNPREIIKVFNRPPAYLMHPDKPRTRLVSPVIAGWRGGSDLTYEADRSGRKVAFEGPPQYAMVTVIPAPAIPSGKQRKGRPVYDFDIGGNVAETIVQEDIPAPVIRRDLKTEIESLTARLSLLEAK